jgi:murein DD-endopeptidase MepM/ murein hydrolase activator NlpD
MGNRSRAKMVLKLFPSVPRGVFGGKRLTQWLESRLFYREFQFSPWKLTFLALVVVLLGAWAVGSLGLAWHASSRAEALRAELEATEAELADRTVDLNAAQRDYYLLLSRLSPLSSKIDQLGEFSRKLGLVAGIDSLAEEMGAPLSESEVSLTLSEEQVAELERRFDLIGSYVASQELELRRTPSISPVSEDFVPTDRFGYRVLRHSTGEAWGGRDRKFHAGLDLAAPTGTPIVAPADGVVHFSGRVPRKQSPRVANYGNFIVLDHGNGTRTVFAHCDRLNVAAGEEVRRGDVIGWVGNTGRSTGPHLHYEVVVNGRPVDPELFILDIAIPKRRVRVDFDSPSLLIEEVDKILGL